MDQFNSWGDIHTLMSLEFTSNWRSKDCLWKWKYNSKDDQKDIVHLEGEKRHIEEPMNQLQAKPIPQTALCPTDLQSSTIKISNESIRSRSYMLRSIFILSHLSGFIARPRKPLHKIGNLHLSHLRTFPIYATWVFVPIPRFSWQALQHCTFYMRRFFTIVFGFHISHGMFFIEPSFHILWITLPADGAPGLQNWQEEVSVYGLAPVIWQSKSLISISNYFSMTLLSVDKDITFSDSFLM